jgi:hypothetical protein
VTIAAAGVEADARERAVTLASYTALEQIAGQRRQGTRGGVRIFRETGGGG